MNKQIQQLKNELENEINNLDKIINRIIKFEDTYNDTDATADERGLISAFRSIGDKIDDAITTIKFYQKEPWREGRLKKQPSGRYALGDFELICESDIEILEATYPNEGVYEWVKTIIKYDNKKGDYYAYGIKAPLEGALARLR